MPQASETLRRQWPGADTEALAHLKPNFTWGHGIIRKKYAAYEVTMRDWSAIHYMCDECDFGFDIIAPKGVAP
jgi:hypothetical protein